jgi:hypothetical protein
LILKVLARESTVVELAEEYDSGANSGFCCTVASWSLGAAGDIEHPSAGPPIR